MTNHFLAKPISQKFSDIIPHFLFSFASPHTQAAYARDIKGFCDFLISQGKHAECLSDITDTDVVLWKKYLEHEATLEPATVRRKLNCLSSLFMFAQKRKFIDVNPLQWIKKPAQKNISKTNALNPDEIKKIFTNLEMKISFLFQGLS